MSHAPPTLARLDSALGSLGRLAGLELVLWRVNGTTVAPLAGPAAEPPPGGAAGLRRGAVGTPAGESWWEPVTPSGGVWLEVRNAGSPADAERRTRDLLPAVEHLLGAERDAGRLADELRDRYEEIDLLYTISETLGRTIRLEEAAEKILRDVAAVVRARRASLFVFDEPQQLLRLVAAHGLDTASVPPIRLADERSIVARVARERQMIVSDPADTQPEPGVGAGRAYRGRAFLSVPVLYPAPGGTPRLIGVINLTDREGRDSFGLADRRLVSAVANQIGAALENARLVARDMRRQRMTAELELARDLQFKLLPIPAAVASEAQVAARCRPAEAVSGDFYNLFRLGDGVVGVMLGDVSGHGFGAALVMALAMSASGIHAQGTASPTEVVGRLEDSLRSELARAEMFLTLFYGIVDRGRKQLRYVNAGLPGVFRVARDLGRSVRLAATRPPLGLPPPTPIQDAVVPWRPARDILCLFTDGVADAQNARGERFGERRTIRTVAAKGRLPVTVLLDRVFQALEKWTVGVPPTDDRTVVLLKI